MAASLVGPLPMGEPDHRRCRRRWRTNRRNGWESEDSRRRCGFSCECGLISIRRTGGRMQDLFARRGKKKHLLTNRLLVEAPGFGKREKVCGELKGGVRFGGCAGSWAGIAGDWERSEKFGLMGRGLGYEATLVVRVRVYGPPLCASLLLLTRVVLLTCGTHAVARRSLRRNWVLAGRCLGLRVVNRRDA